MRGMCSGKVRAGDQQTKKTHREVGMPSLRRQDGRSADTPA